MLDPDVVLRADSGTALPSAVVHGAEAVAGQALLFEQPTTLVRPALVNAAAGAVVTVSGEPTAVMGFTVFDGKIVRIDVLADPDRLRQLDLAVLDN